MNDYIDFLFEDEETCEQFLVELEVNGQATEELIEQAQAIADEYFDNAVLQDVVDQYTAEAMGLDTY